ncbi:uncharacterized protein IL334_004587 [Kwoniella shivajii]|uniref:Zn(2)-C6 fungal-type domain-containing protein n=1 Tax=Kwoniella shivajii TaxID=564305 RepID=A0ABZ1D0R2_9TREE|nr:hypothetical protein IL334_004587 [Kwoniella shivajii]
MTANKRKATESETSAGSIQPPAKRSVNHTSRACDSCRRRKIRCDGSYPQCTVCKERGCACEYKDEDKRKTHTEHMEDLNTRMDNFERLIKELLHAQTVGQNVPPPMPSSANESTNARDHTIVVPTVEQSGPDSSTRISVPDWTIDTSLDQHAPNLPSSSTYIYPETSLSPVASTRLKNLGGTHDYERFQRVGTAAGALLQYGPTSLWTVTSPRQNQSDLPSANDLQSGDWIDWSHSLPPTLNISRTTHDQVMSYVDAFYAPWGLTVDIPAFLYDLNTCNLVRAATQSKPNQTRTASYSPLLHCCVLYLGLRLVRHEHPVLMSQYESIFVSHCLTLLLEECDHTALSSLRAYGLFSTCIHFVRMSKNEAQVDLGQRQFSTGYLYSGMAIAGVHALGLNINCQDYVSRGLISEKERNLREYAFWSTYIHDTLRALAAGRQPMLVDQSGVPFPTIDHKMDDVPWINPNNPNSTISHAPAGIVAVGVRSMRSTTFHWSARLAYVCRVVLETLYSPAARGSRQDEAVTNVSRNLDEWYRQFPFRSAELTPLPHILILHMYYNMTMIFVHRPLYRSNRRESAEKCNQAAKSILGTLQIFERTHGLRYAHHNLINVIFGAATIFLLQAAEPSLANSTDESKGNFEQCVDFMGQLSLTWVEASIARNILLTLQSDYEIPRSNPPSHIDTTTVAVPWIDPFNDMQDIWGMMFSGEQSGQWQDFGNSYSSSGA